MGLQNQGCASKMWHHTSVHLTSAIIFTFLKFCLLFKEGVANHPIHPPKSAEHCDEPCDRPAFHPGGSGIYCPQSLHATEMGEHQFDGTLDSYVGITITWTGC